MIRWAGSPLRLGEVKGWVWYDTRRRRGICGENNRLEGTSAAEELQAKLMTASDLISFCSFCSHSSMPDSGTV